jgi:hypothetical protein
MKRYVFEVSKGRFKIQALVQKVGQDILVSMWGGTLPHIGAVGMATPRPSLRDPKKMSATSSTFTYVGHKEDAVVKRISELLASRLKTKVVVSAGIHWDDLTSREIAIIAKLTQKLSAQILKKLEASG